MLDDVFDRQAACSQTESMFVYDVFISYSSKDQVWVLYELLPWLEAQGYHVCIDFRDFIVGEPVIKAIERALMESRHTLVILTPNYLQRSWAELEALMLQTLDPANRQHRLLPVLKEVCELPVHLRYLNHANFIDPQVQDLEWTRLRTTIGTPLAQVQFSSLDPNIIPTLAPLPSGSRMPLSQNPLFAGRDNELRELATILKAGGTAAIGQIAAATGLGGIGKTQLACEFVHHYGQYFAGGVFWLSFADPAAIPAEVAACGSDRGMRLRTDFDQLSLDKQMQLVQAAWENPLPRLLVFDNCEDEALLDEWRPKYGGCRVLVTSRRVEWDIALGVHLLPLNVLPRPESIALLRSFRPDLPENDADLNAIAAELGDLPLALHLAGSYLKRYQQDMTAKEYLDELHTATSIAHESLEGVGVSPTKHDLSVARTFRLSYDRLNTTTSIDTLALAILARAACFAPGEPIPRDLLKMTLQLPAEDARKKRQVTQALRRLSNMGLLEAEAEGTLRLHQLLAAFMRSISTDINAQKSVENAVLMYVNPLTHARDPRPVAAIQPHLHFITNAAQQCEDEQAVRLLNALGYHLWMVGAYTRAQQHCEQALLISKRVMGLYHPDTATSLHNLGMVHGSKGDNPGAWRCFEQALAIREQVLGADHPDTADSLIGLGGVLYAQGRNHNT